MAEIIQYQQKNQGPLQGIRVLDFSMLLPGPLCSLYLGDMGAEVIKVEHPMAPDNTRKMGKSFNSKDHLDHANAYFYILNRNKKSLAINYKRKEGVEILKQLLPEIDIVIEGFRPGMMEKIDFGYHTISKINPRIIYCSISGYGSQGKYKDHAGHDANYLAISGILDLIGDKKPTLPAFQIADVLGGTMHALIGILSALFYREKTGKGQYIDISMCDSTFSVATLTIADYLATQTPVKRNRTYLSGLLPNYQIYECADGRYVVLAALEGSFFQVFLKQIDKIELLQLTKEGKYEEVKKELIQFFKSKTYSDLEPVFRNPNACLSPVLTIKEVFENPYFFERKVLIQIHDDQIGLIQMPGFPFRFSETSASYRLPPPRLGEHTEEILKPFISKTAMETLEKKKILYRAKK